jgi:hypothetical protein
MFAINPGRPVWSLASLAAALLLAACAHGRAAKPAAGAPPDKPAFTPMTATFVEQLSFGYWTGEPNASDWIESREIPTRPGLRFGWRIKLKEPHGKYVRLIERLTAPLPPMTWGPLEKRRLVSADREVATVPNTLLVRDHWIQRSNWMISDGDPPGVYQMEVQINGRPAARFAFSLSAQAAAPPTAPAAPEGEIEDELPDELPAPAEAAPPADATPEEP